jgi:hypothetical protein
MPKFRKKPVVVEAIRARDAIRFSANDWEALPVWLRDAYEKGGVVFTDEGVHLPTLEGTMEAKPDDWIICGVKGEVYPCKPDIFAATYEPVEEA